MENNKNKTYWPHMIVGFLFIGLALGFWTIKSASSMPVEKENAYMMSYQDADKGINEIMAAQEAFDKKYKIEILNTKTIDIEDNNNSRKYHQDPIELATNNNFEYEIKDANNTPVSNLTVTFLLTRPATDREDQKIENITPKDGKYIVSNLKIENKGRYTLVLRAASSDGSIGFLETPAYLK